MYLTGANTPEAGGIVPTGPKTVLNATAIDSFGNSLTVTAKLSDNSTFAAGNYVTYILTATDKLGNVSTLETAQIGVYDLDDITFSFVASKKNIKLTSRGEEFNAKATDSFGNLCDITIEAADGYTIAAGNTISLYLVATDAAGNRKYSNLITNKNVYGMPTVDIAESIYEDTDIDFIATVYDSFGDEIPTEITWTGTQKVGEYVYVTVKAKDDAGNAIENAYSYLVVPYGYVYTLKEDGTYELTSYTGTDSEVEIWSTVNGKAVTSIAANAFKGNTSITSVTISGSVTSIGSSAFYYCDSLKSITIPDSVTSIGDYAFYGCDSLESVTFGENSQLTSIVSYAFSGCTSLTSVKIGNGVTSIGDHAFYYCDSLTSIVIPNSVTSIGDHAFINCYSLTSITFEDASTWYRTTSFSDWDNKTGGTSTSVTNSSTNASYFKSTYDDYYWYKL